MFAHRVTALTGPDGLIWTSVEEPVEDGGVVVDVVAAGVSYADLLQTTGAYQVRVPVPFTAGMDAAGVVRSAPADAGLTEGQRVAVLASYGCWQEVVSVPATTITASKATVGQRSHGIFQHASAMSTAPAA